MKMEILLNDDDIIDFLKCQEKFRLKKFENLVEKKNEGEQEENLENAVNLLLNEELLLPDFQFFSPKAKAIAKAIKNKYGEEEIKPGSNTLVISFPHENSFEDIKFIFQRKNDKITEKLRIIKIKKDINEDIISEIQISKENRIFSWLYGVFKIDYIIAFCPDVIKGEDESNEDYENRLTNFILNNKNCLNKHTFGNTKAEFIKNCSNSIFKLRKSIYFIKKTNITHKSISECPNCEFKLFCNGQKTDNYEVSKIKKLQSQIEESHQKEAEEKKLKKNNADKKPIPDNSPAALKEEKKDIGINDASSKKEPDLIIGKKELKNRVYAAVEFFHKNMDKRPSQYEPYDKKLIDFEIPSSGEDIVGYKKDVREYIAKNIFVDGLKTCENAILILLNVSFQEKLI